jgi:hypothetical protein
VPICGPFRLVRQIGSVEYSLRALVPGKARAMVADDPGHLAGMVPPPKWPLSRRSSRHSYSEGYRELR